MTHYVLGNHLGPEDVLITSNAPCPHRTCSQPEFSLRTFNVFIYLKLVAKLLSHNMHLTNINNIIINSFQLIKWVIP